LWHWRNTDSSLARTGWGKYPGWAPCS